MKELKRNIALMLVLCLIFTGIIPAYADEVVISEISVVQEETENAEILQPQQEVIPGNLRKATPSDADPTDDPEYVWIPEDCLCFEALENGVVVWAKWNGHAVSGTELEFAVKKANGHIQGWQTVDELHDEADLNIGDCAYFRALGSNRSLYWGSNSLHFVVNKKCNVKGKIGYLLERDGKASALEDALKDVFRGAGIVDASELILLDDTAPGCYEGLFSGCGALERAPRLPAMHLEPSCYGSMFCDCENLTEAPELPAMSLASNCYEYMFSGCSRLQRTPELPATHLEPACYQCMFENCSNLTEAYELPAQSLPSNCYDHMFAGCSKLEKAPALPGRFLYSQCYNGMFSGCSSLNEVAVGFDLGFEVKGRYTAGWLSNVSPTGVFICPVRLTIPGVRDSSSVPEGWKIYKHYVELDPNGGTGTAHIAAGSDKKFDYTLPGLQESGFTAPTGKVLAGWSYTADGDKITGSSVTVSGAKKLYALWKTEGNSNTGDAGEERSGGDGQTMTAAAAYRAAYSAFWKQDASGTWTVVKPDGELIRNAWLCDDAITANGKNVWYLLTQDGALVAAGLVQDNTGSFYSLETEHNGYFGMMRYRDGYYNCSGQSVYLTFNREHNGSFGAVTNADGLEKLKQIYGISKYGIGSENFVYTAAF